MTTFGIEQRLRDREPDRDVTGRRLALPPESWLLRGGSQPEYYIYRALQDRGLVEGIDFTYQSPQAG